jgi:hypothetical protein
MGHPCVRSVQSAIDACSGTDLAHIREGRWEDAPRALPIGGSNRSLRVLDLEDARVGLELTPQDLAPALQHRAMTARTRALEDIVRATAPVLPHRSLQRTPVPPPHPTCLHTHANTEHTTHCLTL